MLEKVGVEQLDSLYAQIPESIRFHGDYRLPSEMSEMEVRELFEKLGSQNRQLTCFAGLWRLRPLHAVGHPQPAAALGVPDLLHALPGRDLAGHAALYLRVPVDDGRADRHGHLECLDVRRHDRLCRGHDDGRGCRQETEQGAGIGHRQPQDPRGARYLRPASRHRVGDHPRQRRRYRPLRHSP